MGGWVKLYRILLDKPIWRQSTPEQKTILITLLLMANHEPNEWEWRGKKFVVQPGQFVTSLPAIQKQCGRGISIRNIRTALQRFEKLAFLTDESSETGRLISILNWAHYQGGNGKGDSPTDRLTEDNRQSTDRRVTANKNDKKDKKLGEGSNICASPSVSAGEDKPQGKHRSSPLSAAQEERFNTFWQVYPRKRSKGDAIRAWAKLKPDDTLFERIMQGLEAAKRSHDWTKDGGQYIPYPASWLNAAGWEDEHTPPRPPSPPRGPSTNTQRALEAAKRLLSKEASSDDA